MTLMISVSPEIACRIADDPDALDEPVNGSVGEGSNLHRGLVYGDRLLQAVCGLELELFGPGGTVTGARE
ncbi:hypothetical protein [Armatimonas sp.]|uniref:hypothetical protein n=1 Tax=Armatimonas sp. TaxID=1872638 RepID=UPI00286CE9CE|nr:hypothetical protein [Armatimonas sp.]